MLDKIGAFRSSAKSSLAAAALARIGRDGRTLDVAAIRDCNRYVLVGNQIFNRKFNAFVNDFRAPLIAKFLLHLFELVPDNAAKRGLVRKNLFELRNLLDDLFVLVGNLLPFQGRQAT